MVHLAVTAGALAAAPKIITIIPGVTPDLGVSAPVYPTAGGIVTVSGLVEARGGNSGATYQWSLWGYWVLSGAGLTGTHQGHVGSPSDPTLAIFGTAVDGGPYVPYTLKSGPITTAGSIVGYDPTKGLDLWLLATNMTDDTALYYLVQSAMFLPS